MIIPPGYYYELEERASQSSSVEIDRWIEAGGDDE